MSNITKHKPGSFWEIVTISVPVMLAFLSSGLMMFCDRLILARYSTDAMNAAVAVGMLCNLFLFAFINVVSITEVFVGRSNGAGKRDQCGAPVWQMIWLSIGTLFVFIPLALFGGSVLVRDSLYNGHGTPYFRWILLFGPMFSCSAALCAYFVGLGKVRLVTFAVVCASALNLVLDIPLVFGIEGLLPAMGTKGAAIATGIAQCSQVVILGAVFLNRYHRKTYGTSRFRLRPKLLYDCLRVGVPSALGHMIEIAGWSVLMLMLSHAGPEYLAVSVLGQTFFILIASTTEGLHKGMVSIASNLIGAGEHQTIRKALRSATQFLLIFVAILAIPLLLTPDLLINVFLGNADFDLEAIRPYCRLALLSVWLYFLMDGMTWILAGILTAYKDTKFVMVTNGLTTWFVSILPNYFLLFVVGVSPAWNWPLAVLYATVNMMCFYLRYRRGQQASKESVIGA